MDQTNQSSNNTFEDTQISSGKESSETNSPVLMPGATKDFSSGSDDFYIPSNDEERSDSSSTDSESNKRDAINKEYWDLADYSKQRLFISNTVTIFPCKRKLTRDSRRLHTHSYKLKDQCVCKGFYLSVLNISESIIANISRKLQTGNTAHTDRRGHQKNSQKISEIELQKVRDHIKSFPAMESHYTRKSSKRLYLAIDLNITKIFELFLKIHPESPIRIHRYRKIFNCEFNYGFHIPKKDACSMCEKYKNSDKTEEMQVQFQEHTYNKESARIAKSRDKEMAKESLDIMRMYTFDLQSVLYSPCSNVSNFYYTRKFASYNLTMYDMATGDGFCYFWKQTDGKRGSNEIGSILLIHLKTIPAEIKSIILYSDCCGGQNRNRYIAALLFYAIRTLEFDTIQMKYLEPGHTHMEVDSMHSTIEKAKKGVPIYSPDEWPTILRSARRRKPYIVEVMNYGDFYNLQNLLASLNNNLLKDSNNDLVPWMKIKELKISKNNVNILEFKTKWDQEEYKQINIAKTKRGQKKQGSFAFVLAPKYKEKIAITAAKKKDLVSLCKAGLIPKTYAEEYNNLPCTASIKTDQLDEPNYTDSDNE